MADDQKIDQLLEQIETQFLPPAQTQEYLHSAPSANPMFNMMYNLMQNQVAQQVGAPSDAVIPALPQRVPHVSPVDVVYQHTFGNEVFRQARQTYYDQANPLGANLQVALADNAQLSKLLTDNAGTDAAQMTTQQLLAQPIVQSIMGGDLAGGAERFIAGGMMYDRPSAVAINHEDVVRRHHVATQSAAATAAMMTDRIYSMDPDTGRRRLTPDQQFLQGFRTEEAFDLMATMAERGTATRHTGSREQNINRVGGMLETLGTSGRAVYGDKSLKELLAEADQHLGFDTTSNPMEAKRQLDRIKATARALGVNVKEMVDTQKVMAQAFMNAGDIGAYDSHTGLYSSQSGIAEQEGIAAGEEQMMILASMRGGNGPLDEKERTTTKKQVMRSIIKERESVAGRAVDLIARMRAAGVPIDPELLNDFEETVRAGDREAPLRILGQIEEQIGYDPGQLMSVVKDTGLYNDMKKELASTSSKEGLKEAAEHVRDIRMERSSNEWGRFIADQTSGQAERWADRMARQAGIRTKRNTPEYRADFAEGLRGAVRDQGAISDKERADLSSVVEPLLDSEATPEQISRALKASAVVREISNIDPEVLLHGGELRAQKEQTKRTVQEFQGATAFGKALPAITQRLVGTLSGDENRHERRRVNEEIRGIRTALRPGTREASDKAATRLRALADNISDPEERRAVTLEIDAAQRLYNKEQDRALVDETGRQRQPGMNLTAVNAVGGDFDTRKGMAYRHTLVRPTQHQLSMPVRNASGDIIAPPPIGEHMKDVSQDARFMAESKTPTQRLAEFFIDGKYDMEAIAKAMDLPDFNEAGAPVRGYSDSNPLPVRMIESHEHQAGRERVPGTPMQPPTQKAESAAAPAQEAPTGVVHPDIDKEQANFRKTMSAAFDNAKEPGSKRFTVTPEPEPQEMKPASAPAANRFIPPTMSAVDGVNRRMNQHLEKTPKAVSEVKSADLAAKVQEERESRGPEAGGSKSREKNEVTLAPGQQPIPVVLVTAAGPLATPPLS